MSITIKDIARLSNVSVSTVSRVLNNNPSVSDEVRRRVSAVIKEHNFVPHEGRANLAKPKTNAIGLLMRGAGNAFFTGMVMSFERESAARGYSLAVKQIGEREDEMIYAPAFVKEKNLKGIILLGGKFDFSKAETEKINAPFVCCTFTNSFGEIRKSRYSSICADDIGIGFKAVNHLIDNGHRDIAALLRNTRDKSISELRYKGYEKALRERNIPINDKLVLNCGDYSMKKAYETTLKLIDSGEKFTAVFTGSDIMAIGVIKALSDRGIAVPGDCSVIGVDGIESSLYCIPTLTTMVQPAEKMAVGAVDILDRLIKGECTYQHITADVRLREGGSVKNIL